MIRSRLLRTYRKIALKSTNYELYGDSGVDSLIKLCKCYEQIILVLTQELLDANLVKDNKEI
jgi:hypothetical protein